ERRLVQHGRRADRPGPRERQAVAPRQPGAGGRAAAKGPAEARPDRCGTGLRGERRAGRTTGSDTAGRANGRGGGKPISRKDAKAQRSRLLGAFVSLRETVSSLQQTLRPESPTPRGTS